MKKRLFSLLLAVLMLCSLAPAALAADVGPDTALHSREEIANYMAQYEYQTDEDETFAVAPNCKTAPYQAGKISDKTRADALAIVNTIRYIAGLPEVTSDAEYEAYAQAAALVNAVNDDLSHYPEKPEQMSDELYRQAYFGASHSNLSYGRQNLYQSVVFGWLADSSSQSNLDTVGHRRWILNPSMAKTGFGIVPLNDPDSYTYTVSAMYSTDFSRMNAPETVVVWPARYTPYRFFSPYVPWSVSVDAELDPDAISVALQRQSDGRTWHFSGAESDGHFSVSTNAGYGGMPCIIFMPDEGMGQMDDGCCVPGDRYTVTVTGALPQTIRYTVEFFDPAQYSGGSVTPHEHNYVAADAQAASCEEGGYCRYVCKTCGESYIETTSALGHDWGEWSTVTAATEDSCGEEARTCERCGESETRSIPPLGHVHNLVLVEGQTASCYGPGIEDYWECAGCGRIFADADGLQEIDEPVTHPVLDHSFRDTVTSPTCTAQGYTEHVCTVCGTTMTDSYTEPLGHSWGAWKVTKAATTEAEGEQTRACSRCGETVTRTIARLTPGPVTPEQPCDGGSACPSRVFTDVDRSAGCWYHLAVDWAVTNKVTTGLTATTFGPGASCTRGQMVTFLWRAKGSPEPKRTANPFVDVAESAYYYKSVLWALENGITTGTDAKHFSPNATVTRAQTVTFLWRLEGRPQAKTAGGFSDVPSREYFAAAVDWAVEQGITNGVGGGKFAPGNNCTRAQIVTFLHRDLT